MTNTPIFFVRKNSIYKTLSNDCYDAERNALTYTGKKPGVYHPPCRLFSKLKGLSTAPESEKELAYWSINQIRKYGGVLEHPYHSSLFKEMNIKPGLIDSYGGFCISINQSWFGHKCEKKTMLYICGISYAELPPMPLNFNAIEYVITTSKKNKQYKEASRKMREATPVELAIYLIKICELIESKTKLLPVLPYQLNQLVF